MPRLAPASDSPQPVSPQPVRVVLDTQVVLDWLVFGDPSTAALVGAIQSGALQWVSEDGALAELRYVVGQATLARYAPDRAAIDAAVLSHCQRLPTAAAAPPGLICRDPDDQRFIDLALASGARWLFSRDRAVLALAKRARLRGLTIMRPAQWSGFV